MSALNDPVEVNELIFGPDFDVHFDSNVSVVRVISFGEKVKVRFGALVLLNNAL